MDLDSPNNTGGTEKMGAIEDLCEMLKRLENGERLAIILLEFLSDEKLNNVLTATLASLRREVDSYGCVRLTQAERHAYELVKKLGIVTFEDLKVLADRFASFKYRSHASAIMNSLVDKGLVGRIKIGREIAYATPKEAVMWALKVLGKLPRECNPKDIADLTGLPLVKVIEVLEELV